MAGGLVGFWISRRALAPLRDVAKPPRRYTGGQLDTRLAVTGDPQLDVLTVSFNEMAQALQDRIERDARFTSEVSHELRSPLMTLAASVEVLENSRDEMSERAQTTLDLLTADVDRFQQLVEDLLEISRFDVGAVKLNLEEVLLPEMVIQAVSVAGVGAVPVVYEDDVSEAIVRVDKRRFGRVIANLLDNTLKYAGGATRILLVVVDAPEDAPEDEQGRHARIVEDEGNGVPEDERQIIFDRFFAAARAATAPATAGWAWAWPSSTSTSALHGGRVWVDHTTAGPSARFVVELPSRRTSDPRRVPVAVVAITLALVATGCGLRSDEKRRGPSRRPRSPPSSPNGSPPPPPPRSAPWPTSASSTWCATRAPPRVSCPSRSSSDGPRRGHPRAIIEQLVTNPPVDDKSDVTSAIPQDGASAASPTTATCSTSTSPTSGASRAPANASPSRRSCSRPPRSPASGRMGLHRRHPQRGAARRGELPGSSTIIARDDFPELRDRPHDAFSGRGRQQRDRRALHPAPAQR